MGSNGHQPKLSRPPEWVLEHAGTLIRIADRLGRTPKQVAADLRVVAELRKDIARGIDAFFVQGEGWLHAPLTRYQRDVVTRLETGGPWVAEILPRFHLKTTITARAWPILRAAIGLEPYTLILSASEKNQQGNFSAAKQAFESPKFEALQWVAGVVHGRELAKTREDVVTLGSGAVIEYRSILSELRGLNRPEAGGRPSLIILDDIMNTDGYKSAAERESILDRLLSMVFPMGRQGSRVIWNGTITHRDDALAMVADGRIAGFTVTPPEDRRAYDEKTGAVLFPERYTMEGLLQLKDEKFDRVGRGHLWRLEMLNDPATEETHPLADAKCGTYERRTVLPYDCHRVIAVDHAHGGGDGDKFVLVEAMMAQDGNVYVPRLRTSRTWTVEKRLDELCAFVRFRQPNVLVIEDTSESRTFIDVAQRRLMRDGLHVNLQRPGARERGAKNSHIQGWLQPLFQNGALYVPEEDPAIGREIEAEAHDFDVTKKNNSDDVLDALATAVRYLRRPETRQNARTWRTGDPIQDEILGTIMADEAARRGAATDLDFWR
jgi:hypothetical protein